MAGSGKVHLRDAESTLLRADNLVVEFPLGSTGLKVHAVSDVSLDVRKGETLGLVGESGCGKSTTGRALMQMPSPTSGTVSYDGVDLTGLSGEDLRRVRPEMQMIFQDPISSLNPRRKVGDIVAEPLRIWASEHNPPAPMTRAAVGVLRAIAAVTFGLFALQMLLWIINGFIPYLLNSDEFLPRPLWNGFLAWGGSVALTGIIFGGGAFALSRAVRDRVPNSEWATIGFSVVLLLATILGAAALPAIGRIVAVQATFDEAFFEPPTTVDEAGEEVELWTPQQLLEGIDTIITIEGDGLFTHGDTITVGYVGSDQGATRPGGGEGEIPSGIQLLRQVLLLVGIALAIAPAVLVLLPPTRADFVKMREIRRRHEQIVHETLENVGLDAESTMSKRPHQFSGGQCQRICIARALVLDPKVIICDEPVSALDVSVQAQILNLLEDMKQRYDLTLVFIAHDLAVVKNVSDRVAVMYLGKICEVATPEDLYGRPAHPYTAALLASIPVPDPSLRPDEESILGGEIPSPVAPPSGCRFRTRCPRADDVCAQVEPKMRQIGLGHYVACHFPLEATSPKPGASKLAAKAAR